ncbi:hypothetical protein Tco_0933191 [Tanacetum coccineum]
MEKMNDMLLEFMGIEDENDIVKSAMQVNFPISPMTRVWSAERGLLKSAMRDSASGRLLSKIKESHVTRSDLRIFETMKQSVWMSNSVCHEFAYIKT